MIVEEHPAQDFKALVFGLPAVGAMLVREEQHDYRGLRELLVADLEDGDFAHRIHILAPGVRALNALGEFLEWQMDRSPRLPQGLQKKCDFVGVAGLGEGVKFVHRAARLPRPRQFVDVSSGVPVSMHA